MAYSPGDTITLTARDLAHNEGGAVTGGATVTFTIYEADSKELVIGPLEVSAPSGDDWTTTVNLPDDHGSYLVKAVAVVGSAQRTETTVLVVRRVPD